MTSNLEKFKDRLKNIEQNRFKKKPEPKGLGTVSYTHLTLPTTVSV